MNQPDSLNVQGPVEPITNTELDADAAENKQSAYREWFPEDDDEWYEPDYRRSDSRAS